MASRNQPAPQDSVTGGAGAPTSKPEISTGHPITKATTGGRMTNLIASNSVTRRYLKRGELMAKRRAEAASDASQEKPKRMSKVDRAIHTATTLSMFGKEENSGSACLPEVALYAAGHRKSKQVTAR